MRKWYSQQNPFSGSCSDEASFCDQLCITLSPDTYECSCWSDYLLLSNGISCKVKSGQTESTSTSTQHATPRLKGDRVAWAKEKDTAPLSFSGSNYAEFPVSETTYLETNITIEFRTSEKRDAILFFAGQFDGSDYISIAIIGPNVILRHDCGEGAIEDMYRGPLALNEWHSATVWRKFCDRTQLKVDSRPLMVDLTEQFRFYKGISMDEGVFIGGAPSQIDGIGSKVGTSNGFVGCIRKLIVNNDVLLDTESEVNTAVNLQDLEYCNPITQTGTASQQRIREIDLSTGKLYKHGTDSNNTTAPSDDVQQLQHVLKAAEFSGSSYIAVPAPPDIVDYLDLRFYFKPNTHSGVIFCWHDSDRQLVVFVEHGFVNVLVTIGGEMVILRSELPVTLHQWHRAEIWCTGKGILMKVDRQSWVESQLISIGSPLSEPGMLYIGGFDGRLALHLPDIAGFHGCVKKIRVNGHSILLRTGSDQSIRECGADPCAFAGCPQTCTSNNDDYLCLCEWPKYGRTCEIGVPTLLILFFFLLIMGYDHGIHFNVCIYGTELEAKRLSAMRFSGHSYLELKKEEHMSQIIGDSLKMEINLKINNSTDVHVPLKNQLLAFAGESGVTGDFFRLLLTQDNSVQVMMNLGSGLVSLTHPTQLIAERWTRVGVVRQKRQLTLSINDAIPITTISPGDSEQLNVYKGLYIGEGTARGGTPKATQDLDGFRGCIGFINIGSIRIDHPEEVTSAINIEDCDL
ncbi:unnamed protein product [Angiostrongylus costaricensis]|uniref:Laminin G domain-containing protein n=1 Tax=Angiostrongylus costaricensis TaxID=334426 RepID=A0A3P7H8F2_ANGCS|nr:unnamed protein product [Angiostrongylus costaricensis]